MEVTTIHYDLTVIAHMYVCTYLIQYSVTNIHTHYTHTLQIQCP